MTINCAAKDFMAIFAIVAAYGFRPKHEQWQLCRERAERPGGDYWWMMCPYYVKELNVHDAAGFATAVELAIGDDFAKIKYPPPADLPPGVVLTQYEVSEEVRSITTHLRGALQQGSIMSWQIPETKVGEVYHPHTNISIRVGGEE